SRSRESARWSVHKRATPSQPRPAQNRRDGRCRSPSLRHQPATPGFTRMRLQDPQPLSGKHL
ncbi:hypothetical protein AVEN_49966-1, partial [Araneus ventricosus]